MVQAVDFKWDMLGAYLAAGSDKEQAQFFHGFAKELGSVNFGSHYARECQMLSVNKLLSRDVKSVLEEYFPSLWFNDA